MLLIGSRAMYLRGITHRPCCDFDFVCTKEEFDLWLEKNGDKFGDKEVYEMPEYNKWIVKGSSICEFEIIKPGSSNELLVDLVKSDPETYETSFGKIPSLSILWSIKDSHKYKKFNLDASNFWKTAVDWHAMKHAGATMKPEYEQFCKLRREEAYAGQKHPKLNVSKDSFFKNDNISYRWDHDSIHCSVALDAAPAYLQYLKDGEEVKSDKNKFFACSKQVQLNGCIEEAAVLAIERSKVPFGDQWSDKQAWTFALAKTSSTICSGFFRQFIFNNIFEILKLYPKNYWKKFQNDVSSGLIKPFTGTKY